MKQILCFGDSNTYGLIPGTAERYDCKVRWTERVDAFSTENTEVLAGVTEFGI